MLELPGANPLKEAHAELDAAVVAAYGFSAEKDLVGQLLELNLDVARRIEEVRGRETLAEPGVVGPGVPPGYAKGKALVSEDCIQPRKMGLFGE